MPSFGSFEQLPDSSAVLLCPVSSILGILPLLLGSKQPDTDHSVQSLAYCVHVHFMCDYYSVLKTSY